MAIDIDESAGVTTHASGWEKYWLEEKRRKRKRWRVFLIIFISLASVATLILLVGGQQIDYERASAARSDRNFQKAWKLFDSLESYKDARLQKTNTLYAWADYAIINSNTTSANTFRTTVSMTLDEQKGIYEKIEAQIKQNTDFAYWDDNNSGFSRSRVALSLLEALPSNYKKTDNWKDLFTSLSYRYGDIDTYIRSNGDTLENNWSVPFVKDLLEDDENIAVFLEGYWYNSNFSHNMRFYPSNSYTSTTSFTTSLPTVEKPYSSVYFVIEDNILYWGSYNKQAVFKFNFLDYDSVEVYCYKDGSTHTMTRQ